MKSNGQWPIAKVRVAPSMFNKKANGQWPIAKVKKRSDVGCVRGEATGPQRAVKNILHSSSFPPVYAACSPTSPLFLPL